jgi:hypothetical protein
MTLLVGALLAGATTVTAGVSVLRAGQSRTRAAELAKAAEFFREHREALAECLDTPKLPTWLARAFLDLSDAFENRELMAQAVEGLIDGAADDPCLVAIRSGLDSLAGQHPRLRDHFEAMTYTGIMANILADAELSEDLRMHGMLVELDVRRRALRAATRTLADPIRMIDDDGRAVA